MSVAESTCEPAPYRRPICGPVKENPKERNGLDDTSASNTLQVEPDPDALGNETGIVGPNAHGTLSASRVPHGEKRTCSGRRSATSREVSRCGPIGKVEEADTLTPQRASSDTAKRGRSPDLGFTSCSQRIQGVATHALDLMEPVVPLSMTGPHPRRILSAILDAYPDGLTREQIAARSEISSSSRALSTYHSDLRRRRLIVTHKSVFITGGVLVHGAGNTAHAG